ncbi:hypothetical protein C9374_010908 [Naegleria lovaniensis]|uniref:Uncharacterized protein n=1 Tax=Naegleria lovaniensis TaxID=51637 RepID=A0AA88GG95_NAELO|nr:uncharacterized protein C9374_010908 [Naegleria lovaniensis]KAG2374338.1 hypothetical protein C9374_010908 [Naegleria lovaniensis]
MPKKPPSKPHRRDSTAAESANSVRHSLLHQEAGPLKLDSTCDWPDVLNQRLAQMVTRMKENGWLLQQSEEIEFNVWKHNSLHGKPHQRKIIFRKGEDEILEIIDGQKQIDITKIREVDLSHDNELTILQANHQTPTSFSFENLNTYLSFGIMFLYGLLRCHDQLQMNENLSCILVQSPNDSNHSHAISSEVKIVAFAGIPVSFTLLSHDILDFQITTLEPIWKATLIAQTLSQHNVKQLKKHQWRVYIELECHRNKKLKKRIPVSIKSSKFCLKHSHFCFHGDAVANANDQIFIDVHTCDMFLNPSFSGFNFELLEIQIFEVTSKSRFHWMNGQFIGGEDSSHLNIDMIQSETKIVIAFSSKKASIYDIELFYTIDDKRASLNSTDPIDSRLTCQISPSIFDHYNILFNNDSLNTSMDALSMVFTAVDAYDNEIELKNLENIEIKLRYDAPTEYLEYADFLQPNHTSIKATYLHENGPKLKASFTPAWKGVYTVVFYFKSRK